MHRVLGLLPRAQAHGRPCRGSGPWQTMQRLSDSTCTQSVIAAALHSGHAVWPVLRKPGLGCTRPNAASPVL